MVGREQALEIVAVVFSVASPSAWRRSACTA
jgi:hypothetical protein